MKQHVEKTHLVPNKRLYKQVVSCSQFKFLLQKLKAEINAGFRVI